MEHLTRDQKIDKIYEFMVGNEDLRQKGLVERVENLEKQSEIDRLTKAKVTGGILVLSMIGSALISFGWWILNKLYHYS